MIRTSLSLCAFAFLASAVQAQEASAVFETLDGIERRVLLAELVEDSLGDATFLRFEGLERPAPMDLASICELELLGGDLLRGKVEGLDAEHLALSLAGGGRLTIGVDNLLVLRFPARLREGETPPARPDSGDRLYRKLPRGVDRVDGLLLGFSSEGIQFEGRVGERTYAWEDVVALFVEPLEEPAAGSSEGATHVRVNFKDGGHLSADYQALDANGLVLNNGREEFLLPLGSIAELLVLNDEYSFLGWLPVDPGPPMAPFDAPSAEPLGMVWEHQIDHAVDGQELRGGGRRWSRGIGVHAPSRLTWKLGGDWGRLRTLACLQDQARPGRERGSVRFRILVDGKLAYESLLVRGGDTPLIIPDIPLGTAQELVLEVDNGGDGPVMDRANWLRPMLLR